MFEKNDKRRLYWLIEMFLDNKIDEKTFCDEFYYCYDLGIDKNTLNIYERKYFRELDEFIKPLDKYILKEHCK